MRFLDNKWSVVITQFVQYIAVGGIAFIVDFGLMVALTEYLGINYLVSASFSFIAGLAVNYALCIRFIFSERALVSRIYEFIIFCLVGIGGLLLNVGIMAFVTEFFGMRYTLAKIVAAFFVLLFNFLLRRQLLFSINSPLTTWVSTLSANLAARR